MIFGRGASATLLFGASIAGAAVTFSLAQTPPRYVVEGLALGSRVALDSATFREFECRPSDQFDGFTWCTKVRDDKERRGSFKAYVSVLHDADGTAVYVNRYQEPAYWDATEINDDIERISRNQGQRPRIIRLPHRAGLPDGVLATWGDIELEALDREGLQVLSEGRSPKRGFLIDYIGDFTRSAREGLPVYRVARGVGFVWVASYDQKGRGTLRFSAVNAYALQPQAVHAPGPPAGQKPDERDRRNRELTALVEERDRQMAELSERLARLQNQFTQRDQIVREMRTEIEALRSERDGLQKQLEDALKEQTSLQSTNSDLRSEIDRLKKGNGFWGLWMR